MPLQVSDKNPQPVFCFSPNIIPFTVAVDRERQERLSFAKTRSLGSTDSAGRVLRDSPEWSQDIGLTTFCHWETYFMRGARAKQSPERQ
jgi:hypothetical protein